MRGHAIRRRYQLNLTAAASAAARFGRSSTAAIAAARSAAILAHKTAAAAVALCEKQALEIADLKRQVQFATVDVSIALV